MISSIHTLLTAPRLRYAIKLVLDCFLGVAAWFTACALSQGTVDFKPWTGFQWSLVALLVSYAFQLPRQHYRLIGFRDYLRILLAEAFLVLAASLMHLAYGQNSPGVGTWLMAAILTSLYWMFLRAIFRTINETNIVSPSIDRRRTLVVGAGRAGVLVAEELQRHGELGSKVIGFIDDDVAKQGLRIHGIPVLGPQELLASIVREEHIEQVVLAVPSATGPQMRKLTERAQNLDVQVKTVPGIFNLLGNQTWKPELRDVSIEDLLRREPVDLDQEHLAPILEDQVVLVTGAGGSIGSEICRQVCQFRPSRLILLGRGENSLWIIERELRQAFPNQPLSLELCDIRNPKRLEQVFERSKPNVVFHAAAHKHVPYLERHPEEAVENNIFGTRNLLEVAIRSRIQYFVNISTDKAVNPTNVLGVTKRVAELLVVDAATKTPEGSRYVSVRFGNVLGSRGSVVPVFQEQIRKGGPVTVTHPDMSRYFMTIPEASQLVLQAGLLGETGKVYVLDMGEPVRIVDLAKDMIRLSGFQPDQDVEIQFTGIRPGEKLFEELFYSPAPGASLVHSKVFESRQEVLDRRTLESQLEQMEQILSLASPNRTPGLIAIFQALVPGYSPSSLGLGRAMDPG